MRLIPHTHIEYLPLLTFVVDSSVESIMLPPSLWDVPLSGTPGLWAFAIATGLPDDADVLGYGCIPGDGRSMFRFTLTDPTSPDLGQFSIDELPSGFLHFSVSGFNAPYCVTRYTFRRPPFSVGTIVSDQSTVSVPLSFWSECDLTPGQHTFEIFATTQDDRMFTEPIVFTYTILDDGVFTITAPEPVSFESGNPIVTVPLVIRMSGNQGTRGLKLEYSGLSPPIWKRYGGAVATGRAEYFLDRSEFVSSGILHLRVSRKGVHAGTIDLNYIDSEARSAPATPTPAATPFPSKSPMSTRTPELIPLQQDQETLLGSSEENPVLLAGSGSIAPADGLLLVRGDVMVAPSAAITAQGLTIVSRLSMDGSSSLAAKEGDAILLKNNSVDLEFAAEEKKLPTLNLGLIGNNYQTLPKSLKVNPPVGLNADELRTFSHWLISGQTLSNCEEWQKILELPPGQFKSECVNGNGNGNGNGRRLLSDSRSLVIKGITEAESGAPKNVELPSPTDSPSDVGLIVGVVVGVVGAVSVGIVIILIRRRTKIADSNNEETDNKP
jgi:hypothetical protein